MNAQTVEYKAKALEPWNLAIFVLINSVLPMLIFAPFILGFLEWKPDEIGPVFGIILIVGNLGPTITAFVLTAISDGKRGVRELWGRFWNRNLSVQWLLIALLIWPVVGLGINLIARVLDGNPTYPIFSFLDKSWTFLLSAFLFGLFVGLREEFGWRGYALPRLQSRWNALTSSIILGVFWALAHLANWFMPPGSSSRDYPFWEFLVQIILTSIVYTWIFNNTKGNVLAIILAHAVGDFWPRFIGVPTSLSETTIFLYLDGILLLVVIPIVVIFGPKSLVRQKREEATGQERVHAMSD
jgi:membrane protease YdiL (CAAX protease family)